MILSKLSDFINADQMIILEKHPYVAFALIIDGKTLTYALEDDIKHQVLALAVERVSPKQKAVVRLKHHKS